MRVIERSGARFRCRYLGRSHVPIPNRFNRLRANGSTSVLAQREFICTTYIRAPIGIRMG